jgi:hypothetical protein
VSGRANDGGLRIGEMERDSVISHGISEFLRESMMERGDKYSVAVCNNTGMLAIYNPAKNLFMSPMADGPVKFVSSLDGKDMNIENITRFGRNFSIVEVPYSFKLLLQELQTCNIQMRLITEDNIEQMENMTFSKNMEILLDRPNASPKSIVDEIKSKLNKLKQGMDVFMTPESIGNVKEASPEYAQDVSPAYQPTEEELKTLFEKSSDSPEYNPFVSPDQDVPEFSPHSPDEPPPQDFYSPHSPSTGPPTHDYEFLTQQANEYSVGEAVYYREDPPLYGPNSRPTPPRLWYIKSIGDKFLTITTSPADGSDSRETLQVVNAMQIYKPEFYSPADQEQLNLVAGLGNDYDLQNGGNKSLPNYAMATHNGGASPAIHFAPVFKIMNNGSDFSTDPLGQNPVETNGNPIANMMEQAQTTGLVGPSNSFMETISPPIKIKQDSSEPKKLDFSQLVIKKV